MRSHSLAPRTATGLACLLALLGCSGGLTLDVQVPKTPTRADGVTPALIVAKVTIGKDPVPDSYGGSVKFSTDVGQFSPFGTGAVAGTPDQPAAQNTTVGLNAGVAKAQLYSVRSGTANVICTYTDSNGSTITKTVQVQFGTPGAAAHNIHYLGANPPSINLQGSNGVTATAVTFAVTDASGNPVADGVTVNFVLSQTPGGASIIPTSAVTVDGTGVVQTVLSAGKIAGTVVITASTSNISAQSDPIQISGRGVNWDDFTLACDSYYIGGFDDPNGIGQQNSCTVFASDVNGMFVPGTQVSLMSEAGGVPRVVNVSPDPEKGYGRGDFVYQAQCPYPVDTDPEGPNTDPRFPTAAGEYRQTNAIFNDWCFMKNGVVRPQQVVRTVNPRDGWATLVAYTIGEECYDDKNGNGQYDPGEEDLGRCDLGEPFLDMNDNNVWDGPGVDPHIPEGEPFYDYDSNGTWTPPNGKWDDRWPIWRKIIMIWTGQPVNTQIVDMHNTATHHPPVQGGPSPTGTTPNTNCSDQNNVSCQDPHCSSDFLTFQWADLDGNCVGSAVPADTVQVSCTGDCIPGPGIDIFQCAHFFPWDPGEVVTYDTNGLPLLKVGYTDGDGCSEPPAPGYYAAGITGTWHLSSLGGSTTSVNQYVFTLGDVVEGGFQ